MTRLDGHLGTIGFAVLACGVVLGLAFEWHNQQRNCHQIEALKALEVEDRISNQKQAMKVIADRGIVVNSAEAKRLLGLGKRKEVETAAVLRELFKIDPNSARAKRLLAGSERQARVAIERFRPIHC